MAEGERPARSERDRAAPEGAISEPRLVLERHAESTRLLAERARLLDALRDVLAARGLLEVRVPPLLPCAGQEPHLHPPEVRLDGLAGPLWLQTSPELALKRLLCGGARAIYSLDWAFRAGREELSAHHQPQFLMLEWYRPGEHIEQLVDDVTALVAAARAALGVAGGAAPAVLGVEQACAELAGIALGPLLDGRTVDFARAARAAGLAGCRDDDDALTLFGRVVVERLEPALRERGGLVFLHGFPACAASLARLDPRDGRVALRVEAYLDGVELANGYVELTDAGELARRWEQEARVREGPAPARDEALLAEMARTALPPHVGMALGVERLHMALRGARALREVLPLRLDAPHAS